MKSGEFRERLLVALMNTARRGNLGAFLDARVVADDVGLERRPGQLRLVVDDLNSRGLINARRTLGGGDEGGLDLQLTNAGIEEAEEILEGHPEYAQPISPESAPASDRYVTIDDNQRPAIASNIASLRSAVLGANEVGDEDRLIAISEIAAFESTISQPRVSAELIERFVNRVLTWIRQIFGEALMGAIAAELISKLIPLLSA